jgi:hypothetical protein
VVEIDTSGVAAFVKALQAERERLNMLVRTTYRKWAVSIQADIATLTPQWGGNLAANWYIDIGSPSSSAQDLGDPSVRSYRSKGAGLKAPYSRGADPAVAQSLARGQAFGIPLITDKIFIHNPVEYADAVELDIGPRPIRPINRVPRAATGKVAMVYHAQLKYSLTGNLFIQ